MTEQKLTNKKKKFLEKCFLFFFFKLFSNKLQSASTAFYYTCMGIEQEFFLLPFSCNNKKRTRKTVIRDGWRLTSSAIRNWVSGKTEYFPVPLLCIIFAKVVHLLSGFMRILYYIIINECRA